MQPAVFQKLFRKSDRSRNQTRDKLLQDESILVMRDKRAAENVEERDKLHLPIERVDIVENIGNEVHPEELFHPV